MTNCGNALLSQAAKAALIVLRTLPAEIYRRKSYKIKFKSKDLCLRAACHKLVVHVLNKARTKSSAEMR